MGLDMYAYVTREQIAAVDFDNPEDSVEVFYWRKHPNLHGWMQRLYEAKGGEDPKFNLSSVRLEQSDLDALEKLSQGTSFHERPDSSLALAVPKKSRAISSSFGSRVRPSMKGTPSFIARGGNQRVGARLRTRPFTPLNLLPTALHDDSFRKRLLNLVAAYPILRFTRRMILAVKSGSKLSAWDTRQARRRPIAVTLLELGKGGSPPLHPRVAVRAIRKPCPFPYLRPWAAWAPPASWAVLP